MSQRNKNLSNIWKFILHEIVASIVVSVLAFVVILWVSEIGQLLSRWQPAIVVELVIYIGTGIVLGYMVNKRLPSKLGMWVWVPPLVLLLAQMHDFAASVGAWHNIWVNFFTDRCDSSECLYELFGTLPFFGSIGYSVGAWLLLKRLHVTRPGLA